MGDSGDSQGLVSSPWSLDTYRSPFKQRREHMRALWRESLYVILLFFTVKHVVMLSQLPSTSINQSSSSLFIYLLRIYYYNYFENLTLLRITVWYYYYSILTNSLDYLFLNLVDRLLLISILSFSYKVYVAKSKTSTSSVIIFRIVVQYCSTTSPTSTKVHLPGF